VFGRVDGSVDSARVMARSCTSRPVRTATDWAGAADVEDDGDAGHVLLNGISASDPNLLPAAQFSYASPPAADSRAEMEILRRQCWLWRGM